MSEGDAEENMVGNVCTLSVALLAGMKQNKMK